MRGSDDLRSVVRFSIGLLCAIAFVLILVILSGNHLDDSSGKAVGTATALAFLGLTGAAGSHLSRCRPELTLFGHLTLLAAVVAFLLTTVALWSEMDNSGEWA
nr:hypothetical protein [Actinomycetota bacterium]